MIDLEKTLFKINSLLQVNNIDYAIIGGVAVLYYGRLRTTEDIDVTLIAEIEDLESLHALILENYTPLYDKSLEFFKRNFVLPVKDTETDVKIDFAAGLSGFDKIVLTRKVLGKIGEVEINICSIEDLILYKLFSARPLDFLDVEELLRLNKGKPDFIYMKNMAKNFIEVERNDVLENLNKYLGRN